MMIYRRHISIYMKRYIYIYIYILMLPLLLYCFFIPSRNPIVLLNILRLIMIIFNVYF